MTIAETSIAADSQQDHPIAISHRGDWQIDGEEPLLVSGQCGLCTWDTRARFRNIRVTTPDGAVLWKGPPKSIQKAE